MAWAEVRAEDPSAFRSAAQGGLLVLAAIPVTLVATSLTFEWPLALALPGWIDWARPILLIASVWAGIMAWIIGILLTTMPGDARRAIAIRRFAEARGLNFMRFGLAPPRVGILFAGGRGRQLPRRLRARGFRLFRVPDEPDMEAPLFRSEFAIWAGDAADAPELQLAVATYAGGRSDPRGPQQAFRYLTMPLPRDLPHLMIDSTRDGGLRELLPGAQRLSLEGGFDRYFRVYAPEGYGRDALELLTPDVMACLMDHGRAWDLEVVEDRLIVASGRVRGRSDRAEVTALLHFAELIGSEFGHQAETYSDPRAGRPRSQVAERGQRLRLNSGFLTTLILCGIAGILLTFPTLLGWLLDR